MGCPCEKSFNLAVRTVIKCKPLYITSFGSQLIHVQAAFIMVMMVIMVSLIQKFPEHISTLLAYHTNICSSNVGYKNNVMNCAQCVILFVSINDLLNDLVTCFHSFTWYIPRPESDSQHGQHRQHRQFSFGKWSPWSAVVTTQVCSSLVVVAVVGRGFGGSREAGIDK